jgi:hypothetical protein
MTDGYPYLVKSIWSLPRNLRERGSITTLDPSQPRVSIYCREESHEDDPWFVASFVRVVYDGLQPRWVWSETYPTAEGCCFQIGTRSVGRLAGDKPADLSDPMHSYDPAFRVRYAMECGTCGLRATRRADEMHVDLEKLYGVGVLEVSLRAFRTLGAML